MPELDDLYQQVIIDHSRSPKNYRVMPDANRHAEGFNPLCGDQISLSLKFDQDVVADIAFQGQGCAISKASASLMTAALKGKSRGDVEALFHRFHAMATTGEADPALPESLAVFAGIHNYPSRVKCAMLSWRAMEAALQEEGAQVSTEKGEA